MFDRRLGVGFLVKLPIKVNANARGHSMQLGKRVKAHRGAALLAVRAAWRIYAENRLGAASILLRGLVVDLTRVSPRELDSHDNLRTSLKPVVDGCADAFELKNDREGCVEWRYHQRAGGVREHLVEIHVTERPL